MTGLSHAQVHSITLQLHRLARRLLDSGHGMAAAVLIAIALQLAQDQQTDGDQT